MSNEGNDGINIEARSEKERREERENVKGISDP